MHSENRIKVTQDGIVINALAGCRGCLDEHGRHIPCPLRAQSQRHFNVKGRTMETQAVTTVVSVVEMRSVLTSPARKDEIILRFLSKCY